MRCFHSQRALANFLLDHHSTPCNRRNKATIFGSRLHTRALEARMDCKGFLRAGMQVLLVPVNSSNSTWGTGISIYMDQTFSAGVTYSIFSIFSPSCGLNDWISMLPWHPHFCCQQICSNWFRKASHKSKKGLSLVSPVKRLPFNCNTCGATAVHGGIWVGTPKKTSSSLAKSNSKCIQIYLYEYIWNLPCLADTKHKS